MSPATTRYRFGDVELVRFVDGVIDLDPPGPVPAWAVPDFAPSPHQVSLAFAAFGLSVDGRRIIVDPWLVTDGARAMPGADDHARRLEDELGAAGFPPAEVDLVVLSHLDGIGWSVRPAPGGPVPMFPRARHVLSRSGIDAWRAGEIDGCDDLPVLLDAGAVDAVDTDATVTGSVTLLPTEGHTPGHVAVRVTRPGVDLALAGHLFLYPNQVSDPTIPNDVDPDRAAEDRRALLADLAARRGALFAQLLGGCGGGRVVADGDGHRLEALTPVG